MGSKMRVTNRMMTNNTLTNINKNKQNLTKIEEQYNTGKKIQKPSDDPIIAIRALKLRSNLSEINQYYERNIPDARSWMEMSEGALQQITSLMTSIHTLCDQGSQDTWTASDRKSIAENLQQYRQQIYQESNATCAGRYVFSGFKTDTSLAFLQSQENVQYQIQENLSFADVHKLDRVAGAYSMDVLENNPTEADFEASPTMETVYRLRLAYGKLDDSPNAYGGEPVLTYLDAEGEPQELELKVISTSDMNAVDDEILTSQSPDAYKPEPGVVNYIARTGELIIPTDIYEELMNNSTGIQVSYFKTEFEKGDLRPEHYFDCTATPIVFDEDGEGELVEDKAIDYVKENQEINYEISFNQNLTINTQGYNSITQDLGREVDEILRAIENVDATEGKLADLEKKISVTEDEDEKAMLNKMKMQVETELSLRNSLMQKAFSEALDHVQGYQDKVDVAIADLGSRVVRLNMTESRLATQQDDFEDLLSTNEDADLVDTIVRFNAQEVIYNASLSAAAKVVQNTLMDFIR